MTHGTLPDTTISGESRPLSNGNEGILHTPEISSTSLLDTVYCHTLRGDFNPSAEDTISMFETVPKKWWRQIAEYQDIRRLRKTLGR